MLFQVSLSFCIGMYSYLFRSNETHTSGLDMPESWMVLGREYIHAGSELSNHLNHSLPVPDSGGPHFRFLVEWMNSHTLGSFPSFCMPGCQQGWFPSSGSRRGCHCFDGHRFTGPDTWRHWVHFMPQRDSFSAVSSSGSTVWEGEWTHRSWQRGPSSTHHSAAFCCFFKST